LFVVQSLLLGICNIFFVITLVSFTVSFLSCLIIVAFIVIVIMVSFTPEAVHISLKNAITAGILDNFFDSLSHSAQLC